MISKRLILAGRSSRVEKIWDLIDVEDGPIAQSLVPTGIAHLAAYDQLRGAYWFLGEEALEPIVIRIRVAGPVNRP